jgi:hypothetical protein
VLFVSGVSVMPAAVAHEHQYVASAGVFPERQPRQRPERMNRRFLARALGNDGHEQAHYGMLSAV